MFPSGHTLFNGNSLYRGGDVCGVAVCAVSEAYQQGRPLRFFVKINSAGKIPIEVDITRIGVVLAVHQRGAVGQRELLRQVIRRPGRQGAHGHEADAEHKSQQQRERAPAGPPCVITVPLLVGVSNTDERPVQGAVFVPHRCSSLHASLQDVPARSCPAVAILLQSKLYPPLPPFASVFLKKWVGNTPRHERPGKRKS